MNLRPAAGTGLLLLLVSLWYLFNYGRVLLHDEGTPAFFVVERSGINIMLGDGFPESGIHQYSDGIDLYGVMQLTGLVLSPGVLSHELLDSPLEDGLCLDVDFINGQVAEIKTKWMPASQRMTLEIPLHPDRMNASDWEALSGIGIKMAERIEKDRQQNGDYGTLEALQRVRGIGPKSIIRLKKYFL